MPLFEVRRALGAGFGSNATPAARLTTMGEQVVVDFFTAAMLDGRGYQVRAGTITAPLTGDIVITDTAAEMAVDAASGTTIIPVQAVAHFESLNGGTLPEIAIKSVATASSAGTAFVPLKMKTDGSASVSTARVQAAGSVTVTAELATTTLRHYSGLVATVGTGGAPFLWEPKGAPVLVGAQCL
ncbi:MAG: hypothetical protein E4H19_16015, partial [Chromatiales bacterium]